MRTHTYQYELDNAVPDSTPPEHRPNTDDTPGKWDHLETGAARRGGIVDVDPLEAVLDEHELRRECQLASLEDATGDLVAIAYKDSVARILTEIRTARRRLREGKHGVCVDCHGSISTERVEALPWAIQCTDCAGRRYS